MVLTFSGTGESLCGILCLIPVTCDKVKGAFQVQEGQGLMPGMTKGMERGGPERVCPI